jgi:hypothetical protein
VTRATRTDSHFVRVLRQLTTPGSSSADVVSWHRSLTSPQERQRDKGEYSIKRPLAALQNFLCAWEECPVDFGNDRDPVLQFWLSKPPWQMKSQGAHQLALLCAHHNVVNEVPLQAIRWIDVSSLKIPPAASGEHLQRVVACIGHVGEASVIETYCSLLLKHQNAVRAVAFLDEMLSPTGRPIENLPTLDSGRAHYKRRAAFKYSDELEVWSRSLDVNPATENLMREFLLGIRPDCRTPHGKPTKSREIRTMASINEDKVLEITEERALKSGWRGQ